MLKISKDKYNQKLMLKGITNKKLAQIAGIGPVTLSRAINGKANSAPTTIGKIAKALDCDPAEILEEVEE